MEKKNSADAVKARSIKDRDRTAEMTPVNTP